MTALEFIAQEVEFHPRENRVIGPEGREDLRSAMTVELARRVEVFSKQLPLVKSAPVGRVGMPGVRLVRTDACDACGDPLQSGRGGMCPLCELALRRVLIADGRLAG
jgi:hypothetical protein